MAVMTDKKNAREARLAKALRDNLRRRKVGGPDAREGSAAEAGGQSGGADER